MMKAKFYLGPRDGAEEDVQTSSGFAPKLYQLAIPVSDATSVKNKNGYIAYYDLQEVKEGIAYYKYRGTA